MKKQEDAIPLHGLVLMDDRGFITHGIQMAIHSVIGNIKTAMPRQLLKLAEVQW